MKILIVDDHVLFREGVALLLKITFEAPIVLEASECAAGRDLIAANGVIDLVLMDLDLPGMSGLDGIAELKADHPEIPVVALSSSDDRETVMRALDAGAMGFIPKSSSSAVLGAAIRLIMANGIYLPACVLPGESRTGSSPMTNDQVDAPRRAVGKVPRELGLTPRQAQVLYLILQGKPAKVIARELELSNSTVKAHTSAVLRSLNVTTRTQAVIAAGRLGLVFPGASRTG